LFFLSPACYNRGVNASTASLAPSLDGLTPPERLVSLRLLAMDVDGVLTDGSLIWSGPDAAGTVWETKRFHARDGLAITLALLAGLQIAWLTGRRSAIVERRARELRVEELYQGARDKRAVLDALRLRLGLQQGEVGYIGDDLNDLPAFEVAGVRFAVADAASEVIEQAHWVTEAAGGAGAVREVIEGVLRAQRRWDEACQAYMARLREEQQESAGQ
jgi:3-deoxy-D-manno-octulosonate 8-phosphate phosphatase (KDO 8-P phosphatase)